MPGSNRESELEKLAEKTACEVIEKLKKTNDKNLPLNVVLAESCTAGLVSSLLACIPGASGVLWGSFVCYTKDAKVSMLGLNESELDTFGLVSRETACKMAAGALQKSAAGLAVAVTGLAGPTSDGSSVPVGTIWIAAALRDGNVKIEAKDFHFTGSRNEVRLRAAIAVLEEILDKLST